MIAQRVPVLGSGNWVHLILRSSTVRFCSRLQDNIVVGPTLLKFAIRPIGKVSTPCACDVFVFFCLGKFVMLLSAADFPFRKIVLSVL
jgi:hypothetical protein